MPFPPASLRLRLAAVMTAAASLLGSCSNGERRESGTAASGVVRLTGAGATFPYPLYSRWFNEYAAHSRVLINYQPIGSGGGIRQLLSHTVDFGATDVPMTDEELASSPAHDVLHIPTVLGAVAITYNLPGLNIPLRLSAASIAEIFLGRITRWNDPLLAALNPGVALPARDILVVHRSDGSGTTYILSDYLATVNSTWANGPGRGKDIRWPVGVGGRGNEGVAGQVRQLEGAIGYIEAVYARQSALPVAELLNRSGAFVAPHPAEISSAATGIAESLAVSRDFRVSLVNASGANAYPIVSFTWMLLSPTSAGRNKSERLAAFLHWALGDGTGMVTALGYVPLPPAVRSSVLARLDTLVAR